MKKLGPWAWIGIWTVLIGLAVSQARELPKRLYGSVGTLPGSVAAKTEARLAAEFEGAYSQFMIVTLDGAKADAAAARILPILKNITYIGEAAILPETDAKRAAILLGIRSTNLKETEQHVGPLREQVAALLPAAEGVSPRVTGQAPLSLDIVKLASTAAGETEKQVLPITFAALVLSFGALGASALPLLAGVGAVLLALGILAVWAAFVQTTVYASNVITMLGLGLGIDYALFIVARIREEARNGLDHAAAVAAAVRHAAPAIAISAATVLLGLGGLATAPARESAGMGLGGMIVAATSAFAAITLLPAFALLMGRWMDAPRALSDRLTGEAGRRRWGRLAEAVLKRPVWALLASLAILLPMSIPAFTMEVGDPDPRLLPDVLESIQGIEQLRGMGLGASLIPFRLVISSNDGGPILAPARLVRLAKIAEDFEKDPRVERVFTLVTPERLRKLVAGVALGGEQRVRSAVPREARGFISRDGRSISMTVLLKSDQTIKDGRGLAAELLVRDWAAKYPGLDATVDVGGAAVLSQEFVASAHRTYPRVFAIVCVITGIMVFWMTRSVAIALKAVLANTLTVGAALGATTFLLKHPVAHHWLGLPLPVETIPAGIPLVAFCVVFGLSMDYEVFLLSRIMEAHRAGQDDRSAVIAGVSASGGVITAAALIMGIVFLGFAMTPFLPIKLLGLALVFGVLLDATVVRLLLVPSLMVLLGRWNWWPGEAHNPKPAGP